jgi:formylglycine-generating enzyme required for sulfatase activity
MMQTAIDKLRELRALHEDGLLSRQEFDSRKNAILDAAYTPEAAPSDAGAPAQRAGTEIGLMAGQEVGPFERRYRLDRLIAHGGMGQVWQATDLATEAELGHSARVALKILAPQLTENGAHARLLIEEAARARQLAHEHIVRVYDWAQDPATASYFIIMECLDGEDFESLLAREGPLGLVRTLQLLAPAADALDHAWARHRLVHRDIKPANLFLTARGEVKLLDFGIAAGARGAGEGAGEAPASSGTAGYRAPEAGRQGVEPGPALDVYATAVLVYRMVSGRLPFGRLRDPLQPATRPDALSEAQWDLLQAGFALDPAARPASVGELLAQLQAEAEAGPGAERLAEEQRARRDAEREQAAQHAQDAERKAQQAAREAAIRAAAMAAAKTAVERQRREQEKQARAVAEEARAARKETLRRQLAERRALEAEKARAAQEEAQRKQAQAQAQAKAAAVYLAEQKRARAELAAREAVQAAAPAAVSVAIPAPAAAGGAEGGAGSGSDQAPTINATEGILRDKFIDADGKGPELVLLPAGRFQMGSPEHERDIAMAAGSQPGWLARELPQHWVGIERPIAMGRYPVLVDEWRDFVRATGWRPDGDVDWEAPGFPQTGRHPVVGVNWFDALRYVRWLSEATGRTYRLPSEAEWEYACRAGTRSAFSCGDTISPEQANYDGNFTYNGGPRGAYRRGTTPAGMFAPNPWGLYDMHGNVWEWVQDVVHDDYQGAPTDGSAWEAGGDGARRILRGGSWLYNPRYLRSALRNGFSAALSNDIVGFRVVRELP